MSCATDGTVGNMLHTNADLGALNGPFTMVFFICPSGDTFGPGADGFATPLDVGPNGGGGAFDWQFFFDIAPNNHTLHYLNYTSGAVTVDQVVGTLSATELQAVAITHDPVAGGGTTELFLAPPGGVFASVATIVPDVYAQPGPLGEMALFNFQGIGTEPLHGEMVAFRWWSDILTAEELANESQRLSPVSRLDALVRFLPMLNGDSPGYDESGNGFDIPVVGTITSSHRMPAVPWGSSPTL